MGSIGKRKVIMSEDIKSMIQTLSHSGSNLSNVGLQKVKAFIDANKTNQGTTFRGLDVSDAILNSYKVGDEIPKVNEIDSWSTSQSVAQDYATQNINNFNISGNNPVVLVQNNTQGIDISDVSFFSGEKEILTVGKNYKIVGIQKQNITTYDNRGDEQQTVLTILRVNKV